MPNWKHSNPTRCLRPALPSDIALPQFFVPLGSRRGLKIGCTHFCDSLFLRFPVSHFRLAAPVLKGESLEQMSADSILRIGVLYLGGPSVCSAAGSWMNARIDRDYASRLGTHIPPQMLTPGISLEPPS